MRKIFHIIIATGFGTGFSPVAPGTAGALLATVVWVGLSFLFSPLYLLITTVILIVVFTILGIISANALELEWGKDPSRVVVDEMVGVWIVLLAALPDKIYQIILAFILFRFFDILKPFGIRKMESLKGGLGVMMDDILAGIYGLIILLIVRCLVG